MKKIVALAACACAVPAWAADVGLGVSAESNDSTIYVPIDFGNTWRLEPFVNYSKAEQSVQNFSVGTHQLRIGSGVFGVQPLGESLRLYYGGRLSYLDLKIDQYTTFQGITVRDEGEGYRISPTLGFEYAFNEHVSLGGEAEWFYENIDLKFGRERTSNGTDTRLILRFRF